MSLRVGQYQNQIMRLLLDSDSEVVAGLYTSDILHDICMIYVMLL